MGVLPPVHHCTCCGEEHPMGWCRLKIAGVEHCGLCGLAHLGHMRTCPHLNDENQVARLLQTLKESPEPRYLVEAATKHLRMIRGDLMQRRRRKMELAQAQNANSPYQQMGMSGQVVMGSDQLGAALPSQQQSNGYGVLTPYQQTPPQTGVHRPGYLLPDHGGR
jgi:hypothetical protein